MKYEILISAALIAAAIVAAGAMNRYHTSNSWRIDGLTGEMRLCRDYGVAHESLCENPAQYRDPNI